MALHEPLSLARNPKEGLAAPPAVTNVRVYPYETDAHQSFVFVGPGLLQEHQDFSSQGFRILASTQPPAEVVGSKEPE